MTRSDLVVLGAGPAGESAAELAAFLGHSVAIVEKNKPGGAVTSSVLGGLAVNGKLITIGASDEPLEVSPNFLLSGRRSIIGWNSETSIDSQDTLSFSVLTSVRSMNEVFPIERAAEAYELMMNGKVARFLQRGSSDYYTNGLIVPFI